ncbi:MAG TPA: MFS transporter [Ktedonobacteraceae bacterium]
MAKTDERSLLKQGNIPFRTTLLVTGIILLTLNLRACITGVGPLVGAIRGATGLSGTLAGLLTTLPLIAFGAVSPLAPRLSRKWGIESMLLVSMVGLACGVLLRSLPALSLLFLGTALMGAAIAISNVLLPSLIKRDFPRQVGLMTAIYSTLVSASGALADGVSIPLAQNAGLGWRGSLAFWALPAGLTALLWLPLLRPSARASERAQTTSTYVVRGVWRSPLAWQVTLYMGLQSWTFYIVVAWFPAIFESHGLSPANAGWLLSLLQLSGVFGSFIVPQIAGRMRSQRVLVVSTILLALIAYAGILSGAFGLIILWCLLLGLAQGAYLGLALLFFILRTPDARSAAELSGMAQSIGYLLAATGPLLFGWLHDITNTWTFPLLALSAVTLVLLGVGIGAGRNVMVTIPAQNAAPDTSNETITSST